jgi:hypothetical protein
MKADVAVASDKENALDTLEKEGVISKRRRRHYRPA